MTQMVETGRGRVQARATVRKLLRAGLSQQQRIRLKALQAAVRKRAAPALKIVHGAFDRADLVAHLRPMLPADFEILMVHSAFDQMLPMFKGTPQDVVGALREIAGPERTVAMPAFVMGGPTQDVGGYFASHPFDVRRTPSEAGIISEVFRRSPGVERSLHPTCSISAQGPDAAQMTENHQFATNGMGPGTPFGFMTRHRTVILGLGVEYFRCLTHAHTAAAEMGDDFPAVHRPGGTVEVTLVGRTGDRLPFRLGAANPRQHLDLTLLSSLLSRHELREWRFHGIPMFLVTDAGTVTRRLIEAARKGITIYGRVKQ
ncbi:MAG: AAC(3) family N-acetyltransferase [Terriglobales bacterium]